MTSRLQGEGFTMIKDAEAPPEPACPEHGPPRNPYQSPVLVEWGSLVELTRGPNFDVQDGDFTGSGGE
jgi:hypothetical protein